MELKTRADLAALVAQVAAVNPDTHIAVQYPDRHTHYRARTLMRSAAKLLPSIGGSTTVSDENLAGFLTDPQRHRVTITIRPPFQFTGGQGGFSIPQARQHIQRFRVGIAAQEQAIVEHEAAMRMITPERTAAVIEEFRGWEAVSAVYANPGPAHTLFIPGQWNVIDAGAALVIVLYPSALTLGRIERQDTAGWYMTGPVAIVVQPSGYSVYGINPHITAAGGRLCTGNADTLIGRAIASGDLKLLVGALVELFMNHGQGHAFDRTWPQKARTFWALVDMKDPGIQYICQPGQVTPLANWLKTIKPAARFKEFLFKALGVENEPPLNLYGYRIGTPTQTGWACLKDIVSDGNVERFQTVAALVEAETRGKFRVPSTTPYQQQCCVCKNTVISAVLATADKYSAKLLCARHIFRPAAIRAIVDYVERGVALSEGMQFTVSAADLRTPAALLTAETETRRKADAVTADLPIPGVGPMPMGVRVATGWEPVDPGRFHCEFYHCDNPLPGEQPRRDAVWQSVRNATNTRSFYCDHHVPRMTEAEHLAPLDIEDDVDDGWAPVDLVDGAICEADECDGYTRATWRRTGGDYYYTRCDAHVPRKYLYIDIHPENEEDDAMPQGDADTTAADALWVRLDEHTVVWV